MPRATVFLTTLICVLTSDGSAQAVPNPGDRIRIKQVDGTVLTGTLTTFSLAAIQMSLGSDDRVADVPVARIEVLETSLGRQPNYPKYIGITVAASSLLGAIIGASVDTCSGVSGICVGPETRAEGVLVGLARRSDHWIAIRGHPGFVDNRGAVGPSRTPGPRSIAANDPPGGR